MKRELGQIVLRDVGDGGLGFNIGQCPKCGSGMTITRGEIQEFNKKALVQMYVPGFLLKFGASLSRLIRLRIVFVESASENIENS